MNQELDEQGDVRRAMLDELFTSIDAMDAHRFSLFLSPDAVFRFGSAPPVEGRAAIEEAVGAFFASIAGIEHSIQNVICGADGLVCEGQVTYTRHDRTTLTVPFANAFDIDDDLISGYRIYIDIGPLYADGD